MADKIRANSTDEEANRKEPVIGKVVSRGKLYLSPGVSETIENKPPK